MKKILYVLLSVLLLAGAAQSASADQKKKTESVTYVVDMDCQNCVNKLTDNLAFIKGVKDLKISLKDKTVLIKYDPAKVEEAEFVKQIQKLGYTVEKLDPEQDAAKPENK